MGIYLFDVPQTYEQWLRLANLFMRLNANSLGANLYEAFT